MHLCSYLTNNYVSPPPSSFRRQRPLFTVYQGQETSAEEARTRVLHLASSFSNELKLQPGDRVATLALATPSHLEILLAATAAGGIAAPLNWRWSVSEATYAVEHIQASVLCADETCLPLAKQVAEHCPLVKALLIIGSSSSSSSSSSSNVLNNTNNSTEERGTSSRYYRILHTEGLLIKRETLPPAPLLLQQPHDGSAFLIFTSGTTGPPRAAVLSHAALHFQCKAKLQCCIYNGSDVYLHTAQLFHVGGLCSALAMLLAGAQHVFLPVFRALDCLKAIEMYSITSFIAVPTMISDLLTIAAAFEEEATTTSKNKKVFPQVRSVLVGAGGLSENLTTQLTELIPNATINSAYGMTEACSSLTFSTLVDKTDFCRRQWEQQPGSGDDDTSGVYVGCPPPGIELAILLLPTPPGAQPAASPSSLTNNSSQMKISNQGYGEVVTRGPHTMLRYWNDPEATLSSFLPLDTSLTKFPSASAVAIAGRWMRTGDLGYLKTVTTKSKQQQQRQFLWLIGRAKDVIKSGGENVPAAEVERALATHPSVAVAAVVGLPDPRLGERVAAVVVLNNGYTWHGPTIVHSIGTNNENRTFISENSTTTIVSGVLLQQHCRRGAGLAGFKLPRMFFVFDSEGEIPRNATGKVVKPQLREMCIKKIAANAEAAAAVRSRL